MGSLTEVLQDHKMIAIDANCFIYYLKGAPWVEPLKHALFVPLERGLLRGVTSILTIAEVLVRPKSLGREDVCNHYLALLSSYPNLTIVPFALNAALRCAEIRAQYKVRTPDAIQLATAWESGATLFLTNDADLPPTVGPVRVAVLSRLLPPSEKSQQPLTRPV